MRSKSDARRQAVVDAAWQLFKSEGFERTAMAKIAARLGSSKGTLYNYFDSKEELFLAALSGAMTGLAEKLAAKLNGNGSIEERLLIFSREYMTRRLDPELLKIDRIIIAEAQRSSVGEMVHQRYLKPLWDCVARLLDDAMQRGLLRKADTHAAAMHLKGLLEADLISRRLYGAAAPCTSDACKREAEAAVDVFLRAYRTPETLVH